MLGSTFAVARVAFPLMLQRADELGIDWRSRRSNFVTVSLGSMYEIERQRMIEEDADESREKAKALRREQRELELDAEAIARIVTSPRVPESIKEKLVDRVLEFTDDFTLDARCYPYKILAGDHAQR
jgi:hypothetical protein